MPSPVFIEHETTCACPRTGSFMRLNRSPKSPIGSDSSSLSSCALQMHSSFRIARVRGIDIGANWTWLLVVALIVWSLADGVFPETNPGLSDAAYVWMGAIAAVVFFVSLL